MKCSARLIGVIYEVLSANVKQPTGLHSANVKRPAGLLLSGPRVAADLVMSNRKSVLSHVPQDFVYMIC